MRAVSPLDASKLAVLSIRLAMKLPVSQHLKEYETAAARKICDELLGTRKLSRRDKSAVHLLAWANRLVAKNKRKDLAEFVSWGSAETSWESVIKKSSSQNRKRYVELQKKLRHERRKEDRMSGSGSLRKRLTKYTRNIEKIHKKLENSEEELHELVGELSDRTSDDLSAVTGSFASAISEMSQLLGDLESLRDELDADDEVSSEDDEDSDD